MQMTLHCSDGPCTVDSVVALSSVVIYSQRVHGGPFGVYVPFPAQVVAAVVGLAGKDPLHAVAVFQDHGYASLDVAQWLELRLELSGLLDALGQHVKALWTWAPKCNLSISPGPFEVADWALEALIQRSGLTPAMLLLPDAPPLAVERYVYNHRAAFGIPLPIMPPWYATWTQYARAMQETRCYVCGAVPQKGIAATWVLGLCAQMCSKHYPMDVPKLHLELMDAYVATLDLAPIDESVSVEVSKLPLYLGDLPRGRLGVGVADVPLVEIIRHRSGLTMCDDLLDLLVCT
ncbi:hypothetical protein SARC_00099 [Sphaeroforma arctica JP610]|uniref:Uncharacterized protein n=1 Tax=Sphaeroforma arctica JP610 TaxID=667725 RepID=A0A0L0GFN7_9EUKA|nr:hypothetical protein SARC_00099 [Sphaeroforma arctica JP610]KNC87842.1 hypothetical protein SARC_00099 [Sphaeroforma arctica JP610]|eukprot:XP_014161744.1 hypothetical protein SARC_00099 [Sphaeroforma arctica JP610]